MQVPGALREKSRKSFPAMCYELSLGAALHSQGWPTDALAGKSITCTSRDCLRDPILAPSLKAGKKGGWLGRKHEVAQKIFARWIDVISDDNHSSELGVLLNVARCS